MNKDKFVLIDGNSLMYRAFYALPSTMMNKDGLHTNVIYGFVNMINKLLEEFNPKYLAIAFDTKAPTFRHKEYTEYKAKRPKMPEEMVEQIPYLKKVLDAMRIERVEVDGYEADDIIGTLSKTSDEKDIQTLIVTGDRDVFQLISSNVHILITKKGISDMEEFDREKLIAQYGVSPEQVVDLKGLMGDASDNIPGIPGVGEKTALSLLKEFSNMDNILNNIDRIKRNKVRENVSKNKEIALLSKKLAIIDRDVPVEADPEKYLYQGADYDSLIALYREMGFRSLLERAGNMLTASDKKRDKEELTYHYLDNEKDIKKVFNDLTKEKLFAFKVSDSLNHIYICFNDKQFAIPINKNSAGLIKNIMEDKSLQKSGHDIKNDLLALKSLKINTETLRFDSMIGAYLLNPSRPTYRLKNLYSEYLGEEITDYEDKEGEAHVNYCSSVKAIWKLIKPMEEEIAKMGMTELFNNIEMPLIEVLADMEHNGFKVDSEMLKELSVQFADSIEKITEEIYNEAGEEFNINSTKQLSHLLFDKLGLPPIKKTKTGYSTDVEVLEKLLDKHPIIEKILEYRSLIKLKSTYVDGLINLINPKTGRIHSKFRQTVTSTGRLSSTDPNLQNIPIKTEEGRVIRKAFVPENENYVLVDADYSQIELRVLAHISGDKGLIEAFKNNEDIHQRTAAEVFGVDKEIVSSLMRSRAKAVNFGIVYGISDFGLSRDLKITRKEAKIYIDSYFQRYPKVKEYMNNIVRQGKEKGYVKTLLNRVRYIPEISSANAIQRNFGERMAMNTPIQGSAADIIKIAMVNVFRELKDSNMKSKLILQVHDELIIEAHKDEVDKVKDIIKSKMEEALTLSVPLVVDLNIGDNWYETK
ncbi:MAG: DNA polymerase I [Firmicutes bacterium]|nr:DNA polymerase I [Bacillota bacterium]